MDERMNIKHIRMMMIDPSIRIDTLMPEGAKVGQRHVPVGSYVATEAEVSEAIQRLNAIIDADGYKPAQCKAPPMLPTCDEPPEHLANAFRAAMN